MKKFFLDNKYYLTMILALLLGFLGVELIGSLSVLFETNLVLFQSLIQSLYSVFYISAISFLLIAIVILMTKKRFGISVILLFFYSFFAFGNLLHVRAFSTAIPRLMYTQTQNLNGLSDSIIALIHPADILYLVIPLVVLLVYVFLKNRIKPLPLKNRFTLFLIFFAFFACALILKWVKVTCDDFTFRELSQELNYTPKRYYGRYGLFTTLITSNLNHKNTEFHRLSPQDRLDIQSYLDSIPFFSLDFQKDSCRKNVVILLVESLNSKALTAKIGDQFIMPNLNRLMQERQSLVSLKIKHPQQKGISIAGQFNIVTGLIGTYDDVFCIKYPENRYKSISRVLKNHRENFISNTIVATDRDFWRQDSFDLSVATDSLFGRFDIDPSDCTNSMGISDEKLLDFAYTKVAQNRDRPFYSLVVTCDMHAPYEKAVPCDMTFPDDYPAVLKSYYSKARNDDKYIGEFIEKLKQTKTSQGKSIYSQTLFVVVADHNISKVYMDAPEIEDLSDYKTISKYTPVFFFNTGCDMSEVNKAIESKVFVQQQIYPTMLSLLGLSREKYNGLFPSILDTVSCEKYDFSDVSRTTNDSFMRKAFDISDLMIRGNYWQNELTTADN